MGTDSDLLPPPSCSIYVKREKSVFPKLRGFGRTILLSVNMLNLVIPSLFKSKLF